jgi:S-disulfanyl-L-cysteine oxidoreductase SoxD
MPIGGELRSPVDAPNNMVNPIPATASVEAGRSLYGVYCAPCHGASGKGEGPVAKYYPPVGDLTRSDVQQKSDGWMYAVIVDGVGKMPSYAHELQPTERWQIVGFLRTLKAPAQ